MLMDVRMLKILILTAMEFRMMRMILTSTLQKILIPTEMVSETIRMNFLMMAMRL